MPVPGTHAPATAPVIVRAFAANAPAALGAELRVRIPAFGNALSIVRSWLPSYPLPVKEDECLVNFDERGEPTVVAWVKAQSKLSLVPPYVTTLPAEPVDGQEVYYANTAMGEQGVAWHLRYRAAVGIWEYIGGGNYYSAQSGAWLSGAGVKAEVAVPGGPTLTIPRGGEYDIGLTVELTQRQNGVLGSVNVTVRKNGGSLGAWLVMLATNEWDTQMATHVNPFGGMAAGDVLSVGAQTTQVASMNVNQPRLWIQARKLT